MDELKPLPLDTESFWLIRTFEVPMLYVDKTAYLHLLITDRQSSNFFVARPRRFGNYCAGQSYGQYGRAALCRGRHGGRPSL